MRVVLVADEKWIVEEVLAALGESRFHVTHVADSAAVVDACDDHNADLVVTDLQVGSMGGMAVIRSVRAAVAAGRLGPTPAVLLLDREVDAFIGRRSGADAWLRKPFGGFQLREMLDSLVRPPVAAEEPRP